LNWSEQQPLIPQVVRLVKCVESRKPAHDALFELEVAFNAMRLEMMDDSVSDDINA